MAPPTPVVSHCAQIPWSMQAAPALQAPQGQGNIPNTGTWQYGEKSSFDGGGGVIMGKVLEKAYEIWRVSRFLHDTKYFRPRELWYFGILRSCSISTSRQGFWLRGVNAKPLALNRVAPAGTVLLAIPHSPLPDTTPEAFWV